MLTRCVLSTANGELIGLCFESCFAPSGLDVVEHPYPGLELRSTPWANSRRPFRAQYLRDRPYPLRSLWPYLLYTLTGLYPLHPYVPLCPYFPYTPYFPYRLISFTPLHPLRPLHPFRPLQAYILYTLTSLTPLLPLHPLHPFRPLQAYILYTLTSLTPFTSLTPLTPPTPVPWRLARSTGGRVRGCRRHRGKDASRW